MLVMSSCKESKSLNSLVYFNQKGDTTAVKKVLDYEPIIQVGDRLSILVTAMDPASVAPYNLGAPTTGATGGQPLNGGFVVEKDGTIQFPQLGKIQVAGKQRKQLVDTLTDRISKYVSDPVVTVQFINFKVTILGEVARPGTFTIPEGRVTVLEALGLAADLTLYSRRDNILIIREINGKREMGRINLLSTNAFTSPYFVLKQNDVVYVELSQLKVSNNDQTAARNISLGFSLISVVSALTAMIINLTK